MKIIETRFQEVIAFDPDVFSDSRGIFFEACNERAFEKAGLPTHYVQDNISQSKKGVVRGMHFQIEPFAQGKLIRCLRGSVLDVCLDIRPDSPTFGQLEILELSEENNRAVYIPPGFAHGFQALEERTTIWYRCTSRYSKDHDSGINPLDPELRIKWPLPITEMSEKDRKAPSFHNFFNR